jgi:hypothetical protein
MRGTGVKVGVLTVAGVMAAGGSALAVSAAGAASTGAHLRAAPDTQKAPAPDVTVLFGRALAKARATRKPLFAKAVVYEADGSTANHKPTSTASGINTWRFVFDNTPSHSKYASATLTYHAGRFGKVGGIKEPFLEDLRIPKAPKMTLAAAVKRLRKAGYMSSFKFVTMRRPVGPTTVPTLYLFVLSNSRNVSVNTVTGKVSKLGS